MEHFESLAEERKHKKKQERLRDEFAMAALPCISRSMTLENMAVWAYSLADAMMEARKK